MGIPSTAAKSLIHPRYIDKIITTGRFNSFCTLEARGVPTRSTTGSITDTWTAVDGYTHMQCAKFDRLPHEGRTVDIIEELKYWTIMLAGYYPNIDPSWRLRIEVTNELFNVAGVDADTQRTYTVITARWFYPQAEPGV